jgi:histidinol-phosphate/aromatic aminotransferase/cobyric acid decarboxylase-like protein
MVRECSNKIGSSEQYLRLAVQGKAAVDSLGEALQKEVTRSGQFSVVRMS